MRKRKEEDKGIKEEKFSFKTFYCFRFWSFSSSHFCPNMAQFQKREQHVDPFPETKIEVMFHFLILFSFYDMSCSKNKTKLFVRSQYWATVGISGLIACSINRK